MDTLRAIKELEKLGEVLEARITANEEMTVRISDTLEEIYNSLWKLRRDIHLIKEHKNAKLKN